MSRQRLAEFSLALDAGEAKISPDLADNAIKLAMLLDETHTPPQVARKLNMSRRTISRYQSGQSYPTLRRAVSVLNLLGYDVVIRKRHG